MADTLAIIDGHYYAYRLFFGMPPLSAPDGRPTGAVFGFAKLLRDLMAHAEITHVAVVFDHHEPSFRDHLYPEYKAHRDPMPPDLALQVPLMHEIASSAGLKLISAPGYEADDVLCTLAVDAAAAGMAVRLLTKDKDIDQVLQAQIRTWDPGKNLLRGPAELAAEKGIRPEQVVDYLCMIGDSADNVPGIVGVGPKTAAKLLAEYGSLQAVLQQAEQLKGKLRERVIEFRPKAELTRELITFRRVPDLPTLDTLTCPQQFPETARTLLRGLGFRETGFFAAQQIAAASDHGSYRILGLHDLAAYCAHLRQAGRFAIDTETTGLDPLSAELVGISFACGDDAGLGAAYLPIQGIGSSELVPWTSAQEILRPLLEDPTVAKIAQNAKYDLRIFANHGIHIRGLDGDPMLASWLLDPARESHGIDFLTRHFLHAEKIRTGQVVDFSQGQTMAQVPVATVARYACEDAQCCWRLAQVLEAQLREQDLLTVYREQEVPLAQCLARMEHAGVPISAERLALEREHLDRYLAQITTEIRELCGDEFNPASPKQVAEQLFERLGLPVQKKTKSGPSTDASVLEALRGLHPLPELLLQYRALSKLLGTYVDTLPGHIHARTGRIHPSYKQTGTETGRLSCEQPNLQNIPKRSELGREIRAAFAASDGTILLAADYSQIELRVLAHCSGDEALAEAFASGADIHRHVAAQVAGIHETFVTPEQRAAAKAVNFGIIYGQTAFGLSAQLGIDRVSAQRFIDGYFARFSRVRDYVAQVVQEATDRGYAQTLAGRRRHIPLLRSSNGNERKMGERIALNSTIQGSAADLIKRAMLRLEHLLPNGAQLLLQIHDELIVECAEDQADTAAEALHRAMTGAWQLSVPLIAEVRRGHSWLDVG